VTAIVDARRFLHRGITSLPLEMTIRKVWSQVGAPPIYGLAWIIVPWDCEVERITVNLSNKDGTWTSGALKFDLLTFAPGAVIPFPAGAVGGTTMFTSSATDDRRPSIAFDAALLVAWTEDHEVRRLVRDTRILAALVQTVAAPAPEPEQEVRIRLDVRRYR